MVLRSSEKLHGSQQYIHQLEAAGADRAVLSKLNQTIDKLGEEMIDLGLSDACDDELYWQQVDLEQIIRHHVANCQHIASKRGIELHVDQPQNIPAIYGQRQHFSELIRHLLENAVIFSVYGRIELSYRFGRMRQDGRVAADD